jgi:O-antigen ligase
MMAIGAENTAVGLFGKIAQAGVSDASRLAVYAITLRSIIDSPLLGYGYGTFVDVFSMFVTNRSVWMESAYTLTTLI